jgi:hypothetical protein
MTGGMPPNLFHLFDKNLNVRVIVVMLSRLSRVRAETSDQKGAVRWCRQSRTCFLDPHHGGVLADGCDDVRWSGGDHDSHPFS